MHNIGAHTNIKHTYENISMVNSESCTKCLKCPFIRSKNEMKEHKETKHKMNFTCQDCGEIFFDENTLNVHVQFEHTNPKKVEPFPCEVCGLFFHDFNLLKTHVETYHKIEGVICNECQNSFEGSEQLQANKIEHHPEIVMFYNMAQQIIQMHGMFQGFASSINSIKQELFLIRNSQMQETPVTQSEPKPTSQSSPPPTPPSSPPETIASPVVPGQEKAKVSFAEAVKRCKSKESSKSGATCTQSNPPSLRMLSLLRLSNQIMKH